MPSEPKKRWTWGPTTTWVTVAVVSVIWWPIASLCSKERGVLLVWLSLASLMVGALVGFLFSSYGEESATLGKIRDWLIGGITALTVANARSIKNLLVVFAAGPGPIEFAYTVAAATFYSGIGFFFMFFQRELILNVLLAQSRAERGKLEGSQQAFQVIQRFLVSVPISLLTGIDYIDENPDLNEKDVKQLREQLYSADVDKFCAQANEVAKTGAVDWDVASKAAYIYYYRSSFEKKEDHFEKDQALTWITRALNMVPLHVDLTMKYADILGRDEQYEAAASILEKLLLRSDSPLLVKQWLGYYLRFMPDRLDDAIRYSKEFHTQFPDESDTFFNLFYAFGRKYCSELRAKNAKEDLNSDNRKNALSSLRDGLRDQPKMAGTVNEWIQPGRSLECWQNDTELRPMLDSPKQTQTKEAAPIKQGKAKPEQEPDEKKIPEQQPQEPKPDNK